jgi:protein-S-isoprenylcysteine O-methyltransferase Ste14
MNRLELKVPPLYIAYVDRFQVPAEERALRVRFGPEYEAYQGRVARWLPIHLRDASHH